jgi:hypothetical protein
MCVLLCGVDVHGRGGAAAVGGGGGAFVCLRLHGNLGCGCGHWAGAAADAIGPPIRRSRPSWRAAASWSVLSGRGGLLRIRRVSSPRRAQAFCRAFSPAGRLGSLFVSARRGHTGVNPERGRQCGWFGLAGWGGWLAAGPVRRPDSACERGEGGRGRVGAWGVTCQRGRNSCVCVCVCREWVCGKFIGVVEAGCQLSHLDPRPPVGRPRTSAHHKCGAGIVDRGGSRSSCRGGRRGGGAVASGGGATS